MIVPDELIHAHAHSDGFHLQKELFHEQKRFLVFGNENNSERLAIIDTKTDKTLFVTFEDIRCQILSKLNKTKESF